ncbi:MAG: hypothetical protein CVV25_08485 [Ignavibacteriae bacterium HGW-Ignavibacteriae-4]|nr:MAG: hypothetical protein CVV25_08485 [Ignavibacteriae bacterium HGW-Ignavibacteriae-4]
MVYKGKNILTIILIIINIILLIKLFQKNSYHFQNEFNPDLIPIKMSLFESYLQNMESIPNTILRNIDNEIMQSETIMLGYKSILLIYSDGSCNICLDSLIFGCNKLFQDLSSNSKVIGIGYSQSIESIKKFKNVKNISFPVYFDYQNNFIQKCKLKTLPVVLMVDKKMRIINSFFINPQNKKYNDIFFKAATKYLQ